MYERLEDRSETLLVVPKDSKRDLGRSSKDACRSEWSASLAARERARRTFDASHSHTIDDVVRQTERHLFRNFESATLNRRQRCSGGVCDGTHLPKQTVEVDVYGVACVSFDQNVLAVSIAQSVVTIPSANAHSKIKTTDPSTKPTIEMTAAVRE